MESDLKSSRLAWKSWDKEWFSKSPRPRKEVIKTFWGQLINIFCFININKIFFNYTLERQNADRQIFFWPTHSILFWKSLYRIVYHASRISAKLKPDNRITEYSGTLTYVGKVFSLVFMKCMILKVQRVWVCYTAWAWKPWKYSNFFYAKSYRRSIMKKLPVDIQNFVSRYIFDKNGN